MLTTNILIYHTFYNCYQFISSFFLRWYIKRVAFLKQWLPFYFHLSSTVPYNILLYGWLCSWCSNCWCRLLIYNFSNFFNLLIVGTIRVLLLTVNTTRVLLLIVGTIRVFLRLFGLLNFNFNFVFGNFVWLIGHMCVVVRDIQEKSTFLHESEIECVVVRNDVIAIVIFASPLNKLIHHQLIRLTQFSTRTMQITVWAYIYGFLLIFVILHLLTLLHKQRYLISVKLITNFAVSNSYQNPFGYVLIKIHMLR